MGLLDDGRALLRANRALVANNVTYSRGAASNAAVPAVQGQTEFEADNGEIIVKSNMVDWLIERADLTLDLGAGEVEIEPAAGDLITEVFEHGSELYRVAALAAEGVWRWHGRDGGTYRIHTVRVPNA